MEKHQLHYIVLDLLELARTTPRNWASTTTVEAYLTKHAAFHTYTQHHATPPNTEESAAGV